MLLLSTPLLSQANLGTIQGGVFDQSGGAIAGASVTIVDVARGVSRPLTTDAAGLYVAPNLIPGTYTVRGEAKGFQTLARANILLEVGQTVRVDLTLQPGAQTQTVTVTSEAVSINTNDATLGGTVTQQNLADLPINGRDFKAFLNLHPGVSMNIGGGFDTVNANGLRASDTGYLVDGLSVYEGYTGNSLVNSPAPAGGNATVLPFDAIQEMDTLQNPKAENGWKPGAIINIGLKSGTNGFHGTAFASGRDTALNARDYFNCAADCPKGQAAQPKAPLEYEQFGGSAGWKLFKDKLFWFADYEGIRYESATVTPSSTPATVSLGNCVIGSPVTCGNPASSFVDACLALVNGGQGSKISPLSAQLAGLNTATCQVAPQNYTPGASESLWPQNNAAAPVFLNCLNSTRTDNGIGKLDYHINDHHAINGYFFEANGVGVFGGTSSAVCAPGTAPLENPFDSEYGPTISTLGSGTWTWTPNSTRVNELRIGYSRLYQPYYSVDYRVNPLAYGINTGVTSPSQFGFPSLGITGFLAFGGAQYKLVGPDGTLQLEDDYSFVHGSHSLKFGGELNNDDVTVDQDQSGKGSFTFSNIQNYLQGSVFSGSIRVGDPTRTLNNKQYALFAQDDWRLTRKLILNAGLRWEYSSVLSATGNQLGNFLPSEGLVQAGNQIKGPYDHDYHDFSPRLGMAWDINGNGKTVVRAGGSLMYSYFPIQMFVAQMQQLGITQVPTGAVEYYKPTTQNTNDCSAGCAGPGNIKTALISYTGTATAPLTAGWQAQTATCVSGGTTACGSIFPSSTFNVVCGDGGAYPVGGGGALQAVPPCTVYAVNPKLVNPYVGTWSAGVQRAITNTLSLDVEYVGTAGRNQAAILDINQAAYGSAYTAAQLACTWTPGSTCGDPSNSNTTQKYQTGRPYNNAFPYLSYIDQLTNQATSNYNGLQVTLSQRPWHGLAFTGGYTLSKALDYYVSNTFQTPVFDSTKPSLQYGPSEFDIRNRFTFSTTYALPSKKSWGQMLEGWQVNSLVTTNTAEPWSPQDTKNDFNGTGEIGQPIYWGQQWDFIGNAADFSHTTPSGGFPCWGGESAKSGLTGCQRSLGAYGSGQTTPPAACMSAATAIGTGAVATLMQVGCYQVGNSVLIPPALGTNGNANRGIFRGPGYQNWDISIQKDWKLRERFDIQFRGEVFNILNHPNFWNLTGVSSGSHFNTPNTGGPGTGEFGCSCATPDQATANPVYGGGGPREGYLGLRLIW